MKPELSVVVSTYNRSGLLPALIESLLDQQSAPAFELILVDNNSSDDTAAVIRGFALQHQQVRYVFEPKQGVAHGRNAGILAAQSDLIVFTDDDGVVDRLWLQTIAAVCKLKPAYGCVGGKVMPRWPHKPAKWLEMPQHWAPLGLLDYGRAQRLDAQNRKCLITANMAVRRAVFEQIGYFTPAFQRTKGAIGTIEDREIQERFFNAGGACWFDPAIIVYAEIDPERMNKSYHRRWHYGHGKMIALLHDPEIESSGRPILSVPGHIYRRLISNALAAMKSKVEGNENASFVHEVEARFCAGFIAHRWKNR